MANQFLCPEHLYVIRDPNTKAIKIGRALEPVYRLRAVQIGNPTKLRLESVVEHAGFLEQRIHSLFGRDMLTNEWYPKGSMAEEVAALLVTLDPPDIGAYYELFGRALTNVAVCRRYLVDEGGGSVFRDSPPEEFMRAIRAFPREMLAMTDAEMDARVQTMTPEDIEGIRRLHEWLEAMLVRLREIHPEWDWAGIDALGAANV